MDIKTCKVSPSHWLRYLPPISLSSGGTRGHSVLSRPVSLGQYPLQSRLDLKGHDLGVPPLVPGSPTHDIEVPHLRVPLPDAPHLSLGVGIPRGIHPVPNLRPTRPEDIRDHVAHVSVSVPRAPDYGIRVECTPVAELQASSAERYGADSGANAHLFSREELDPRANVDKVAAVMLGEADCEVHLRAVEDLEARLGKTRVAVPVWGSSQPLCTLRSIRRIGVRSSGARCYLNYGS